jgi:hypothetical protein
MHTGDNDKKILIRKFNEMRKERVASCMDTNVRPVQSHVVLNCHVCPSPGPSAKKLKYPLIHIATPLTYIYLPAYGTLLFINKR